MRLVYWTCRRALNDPQLAEDASQAVFLLLAQKAKSLKRGVVLSGWLFNTSRHISRNMLREEHRRRQQEEEVLRTMAERCSSGTEREEVEKWLNDALAALTPGERHVILMRYFEDLSYKEIAERLGVLENTAGKRAGYAVEKMRRRLLKSGTAISSAILVDVLTQQQARAIPGTARDAAVHAVHQYTIASHPAPAGPAHIGAIHKGVTGIMHATTYKLTIAAVAVVLLGLLTFGCWDIYRTHFVDSGSAQPTFIDLTTARSANLAAGNTNSGNGNAAVDADHRAITSEIRQDVSAYNHRDLGYFMAALPPDGTIQLPDGSSWSKDDYLKKLRKSFANQPTLVRYVTLVSLDVNGDQATSQIQVRYGGQSHGAHPPEEDSIRWTKRDGQWIVTGMTVS